MDLSTPSVCRHNQSFRNPNVASNYFDVSFYAKVISTHNLVHKAGDDRGCCTLLHKMHSVVRQSPWVSACVEIMSETEALGTIKHSLEDRTYELLEHFTIRIHSHLQSPSLGGTYCISGIFWERPLSLLSHPLAFIWRKIHFWFRVWLRETSKWGTVQSVGPTSSFLADHLRGPWTQRKRNTFVSPRETGKLRLFQRCREQVGFWWFPRAWDPGKLFLLYVRSNPNVKSKWMP